MPIPDDRLLILPTLKLSATGEIQLKDGINMLSEGFNLNEEAREHILPSGNMSTSGAGLHGQSLILLIIMLGI